MDEKDERPDNEGVGDSPEMAKKETTVRFYFTLTYQLAGEDITKVEHMDDIPMYLCLNVASLMKERHDKEQEEIRKMKREMKK